MAGRRFRRSDYDPDRVTRAGTLLIVGAFFAFFSAALLALSLMGRGREWFTVEEATALYLVTAVATLSSTFACGILTDNYLYLRKHFGVPPDIPSQPPHRDPPPRGGGDASSMLMYSQHPDPNVRLGTQIDNTVILGKFTIRQSDVRILYEALHQARWHWSKRNLQSAKRPDGSYCIPNLTGSAFSELREEFDKLRFFDSRDDRKMNAHGRMTLREAAGL